MCEFKEYDFMKKHSDLKDVISGVTPSGSADLMASRDIFEDTWVSTDDEGRAAEQAETAPNEKQVGIFYFMWHDGSSSNKLIDHSAAYYSGGVEKLEEVMQQGPMGFAHYWAEPYFGYYRSDDDWVLRKHANQLTAAGIDFIFFDFTNGLIYEKNLEKLLVVWNQMRIEGSKVPKLAFNLGDNPVASAASFKKLNSMIFAANRYSDMWYLWDGKPLVLAPPSLTETLSDEVRNKFTFRRCWAYTKGEPGQWYTETDGRDCWPWADMYPQLPGKNARGDIEQMIVMCGFWVNGSYGTNGGRSYANGTKPKGGDGTYSFSDTFKTSGKGLGFREQFSHAIEADPKVIMLTGWNEWWAGRWEAGPAIGQTILDSYTVTPDDPLKKNYYVDCFSPEYSRDIEPVKGLYNDNYYCQTVQNIRKFKGTRAIQSAFGQKPIDLDKDISQWYSVGPEYRDHVGDTCHRDFMSYVGRIRYVNTSGRNDFINMKVSHDSEYFYFMAECADNITPAYGTNWMNLFLDSDADASTGWYGYDYMINRFRNGNKCSVEKFTDGKWELTDAGEAEYRADGRYIVIKISGNVIDLPETFDFKWADNSVCNGDIMQFIDQGDTAPSDRFNYRFTTAAVAERLPAFLPDSAVVLKAGSYNAYANGKTVMLDSENTYAVMMGCGDDIYIPKRFADDILKVNTSELDIFDHYGTEYVNIGTAIYDLNKTVTRGTDIIVIADRDITNEELTVLYRSLY